MSKVLGFTKNNDKYANVPDALKWAIPIHECVSRPEVIAESRAMVARVKRELEAEEKAKVRSKVSLVSDETL